RERVAVRRRRGREAGHRAHAARAASRATQARMGSRPSARAASSRWALPSLRSLQGGCLLFWRRRTVAARSLAPALAQAADGGGSMSPGSFLHQIETCHAIVKLNAGGLTHEESLVQPVPAGNCLNWVLGHLVATRSHLLRGLGDEPLWDDDDWRRYDRHGNPI